MLAGPTIQRLLLAALTAACLANAAPVEAEPPQPPAATAPAPRLPAAAPPGWGIEQRDPQDNSHWLVRLLRFVVGMFQVSPGQPPYLDPFSVDDPQRPWRQPPPRR